MTTKIRRFWSTSKRFRIMLTLELAVMLPAAALIYVNFAHVKSIKRDKNVEAAIHRDFQYMLSVSEKRLDQKIYSMAEQIRDRFPSPDADNEAQKAKQLDLALSKNPLVSHAFLFDDEKGLLFRSQSQQMTAGYFSAEHDRLSETFRGWFGMEGKAVWEGMYKKIPACSGYAEPVKRPAASGYLCTVFFTFPQLSKDRTVFGGVSFDPDYLRQNFFPEMLDELVTTQKVTEDRGNPLAMALYPSEPEG